MPQTTNTDRQMARLVNARHDELSRATSQDLLYLVGLRGIFFYSYDPDLKRVGEINIAHAGGLCVDMQNNVWVADTTRSRMVEYAHGGTTPIATLTDSNAVPYACAVDPATGDLAVVRAVGQVADVAVYTNGQGTPKIYRDPNIPVIYSLTYAGGSNLLIDGIQDLRAPPYFLDLLPSGGSEFQQVGTYKRLIDQIQSDGKDVLASTNSNLIYRLYDYKMEPPAISISAGYCFKYFVFRTSVFVNHRKRAICDEVQIYKYPNGGSPQRTLTPQIPDEEIESLAISAGSAF